MKKINEVHKRTPREIKVVQFGEGNFLRAFVDYMIDIANEKGVFNGDVAIVKPISFGSLERFHKQDNLYTVSLRGKLDGKTYVENRAVTCVNKVVDSYSEYEDYAALAKLDSLRFVVSNTTEAGIVYDPTDKFELTPPNTYPGKLTKFLYERFQAFNGAADKGLIILPVELIENNGGKLKECVLKLIELWNLGDAFKAWVCDNCVFCSTLVDRIVSGYPRDKAAEICEEIGYEDELLDNAEPFALWVIESDKDISAEFPMDKALEGRVGMDVIFTDNQKPYRERKVRILNGAHTSTVLAGYLAGKDIVRDCMNDKDIRGLMEAIIHKEVVPTVKLPTAEAEAFAASVFERFENPFVDHAILSISLNSVSKWKSRLLPTFRDDYNANGKCPKLITFSFAALMAFYSSDEKGKDCLIGHRGDGTYEIHDDQDVLDFFAANCKKPTREFVTAFASAEGFWGEDLTKYEGFVDMVTEDLDFVKNNGMAAAIKEVLKD